MTIKFKFTATIEVPDADKFPPKEAVEKSIAEILEFEGMVSHELAVTNYCLVEEGAYEQAQKK